MEINLSGVKIDVDWEALGAEEIAQNLRVLFSTAVGAVPYDRDFGINVDAILGTPLPIAQGRLVVEYTEKTRRYEPRAEVKEVIFDSDPNEGKLVPRVVIDIVSDD